MSDDNKYDDPLKAAMAGLGADEKDVNDPLPGAGPHETRQISIQLPAEDTDLASINSQIDAIHEDRRAIKQRVDVNVVKGVANPLSPEDEATLVAGVKRKKQLDMSLELHHMRAPNRAAAAEEAAAQSEAENVAQIHNQMEATTLANENAERKRVGLPPFKTLRELIDNKNLQGELGVHFGIDPRKND